MVPTYWTIELSDYGERLVGEEGDVMLPPETWEEVKVVLANSKIGK